MIVDSKYKYFVQCCSLSEHPKKVEPHERRSVYIRDSGILGGGEGIFARRTFAPGAVVAYFNGVRVTEDQVSCDWR